MTWAWFLLVAVTMLAWWLADGEQEIAGGTTTAIFLTACVKIWVIGYQFMELVKQIINENPILNKFIAIANQKLFASRLDT